MAGLFAAAPRPLQASVSTSMLRSVRSLPELATKLSHAPHTRSSEEQGRLGQLVPNAVTPKLPRLVPGGRGAYAAARTSHHRRAPRAADPPAARP